MASKKKTNEEFLAEFDDIEDEFKSKSSETKASDTNTKDSADDDDPLAELANLAKDRPKSRPHTPKVGSNNGTGTASPARKSADEKPPRKSQERGREFHQSMTPGDGEKAEKKEDTPASPSSSSGGGGGGWFGGWGGIVATAQSAVKQAEALAKEIQKNEEAQRWAEQVKGNVGALKNYGDELRSRALPTFTNILHTLAPPISSHERLQIHTTHDLSGYPSLDPLIYSTFSRVMSQVEGGELTVLQRGHESSSNPRRDSSSATSTKPQAPPVQSTSGWSDGPWWRASSEKRDLGAVTGLVEGTKLCRVAAEQFATDYFAARGGVEEAAKQAAEVLSETNPTRSSDIFLAVQPIAHDAPKELFAGAAGGGQAAAAAAEAEKKGEEGKEGGGGVVDPDDGPEHLLSFAVYLHDPIHSIAFSAVSQSLPQRWVAWLDNLAAAPEGGSDDIAAANLPDEIRDILNSGGGDPREWVSEWVEEVLGLAVGVVAQRYVARRLGVGEGGIKGKERAMEIDAGAGEAARAM